MTGIEKRNLHFLLTSTGKPEKYKYPGTPISNKIIPPRDRENHGSGLLAQVETAKIFEETQKEEAQHYDLLSKTGIQVTFDSFPGVELAIESLADVRAGIELLNVKKIGDKIIASIFIPEGKLHKLEAKIQAYMEYKTTSNGKPRDNRALIDAIESLKVSAIESLWTDAEELYPKSRDEEVWWEVWLPVFDDRNAVLHDFKVLAEEVELEVSSHTIEFPERTVLNVKGSRRELATNTLLLSLISELRLAKDTAAFFDELEPDEQKFWGDDLLHRLQLTEDQNAPYVCLLDSGTNYEHPLLKPFTTDKDHFVVDPTWVATDDCGHGTNMAGLALWGDLTEELQADSYKQVNHRLESVKLLRYSGDNEGKLLGAITADGVALPEIENHDRKRVFSMALSSLDGRDRGRPSSWSSTLDSLACDYLGDNLNPRLFTICAGNTGQDLTDLLEYPIYNETQDIHDPGQAWNALTIGAYTQKNKVIEGGDYIPLATAGTLSPYSTTSVMWDRNMPIKPEVVFEGGNVGYDRFSCTGLPSLKLLSTNSDFKSRLFSTSEATSAATSLAANFAATLSAQYPEYWPETIRAMIVHSAYWTKAMFEQVNSETTIKKQVKRLIRLVGYGVPNLERAMWSANNSLSLVVQDRIKPYYKPKGKQPTSRDMHIHDLPWPKESLLELGEVDVEMAVTLSYFIEPNPSSRNVSGKYSYPSHQLRFDVKRPSESVSDFKARLSLAARNEETGVNRAPQDPDWLLGNTRHKGSVHKDIWRGSAAELAERGSIAIYPAMGWWRSRTQLKHWDKEARYSLIISIAVPEVEVDLYTKIESLIKQEIVT
ncbi:hypothetical protein CWC18_14185 [Pseudoalteromonas aurantia]|uniref:S8 family peptidase n=1 Tax=Pseudoalteromonas aurantia TaxID=43654 RepID=UPI00110BDDA4|nr:S8 family peptidase [Pseudoalteromonas aurantia]TMO60123.1 hypothetical protein CWC18_14185 [Pseudoalteromonas aurantia]